MRVAVVAVSAPMQAPRIPQGRAALVAAGTVQKARRQEARELLIPAAVAVALDNKLAPQMAAQAAPASSF